MNADSVTLYHVKRPYSSWGDYGAILIAGMSRHLPRQDGLIQLERTGPFIPPISLPGAEVIVTNLLKESILTNTEFNLQFLPVIKKRIVWLAWEAWDKTSKLPQVIPESGEPEDYILSKEHSEEASQKIGDLWEIVFPECSDVRHCTSNWFKFTGSSRNTITDSAMKWLQKHTDDWVQFERFQNPN